MNTPIVPTRNALVSGPAATERGNSEVRVMVAERRSVPASLMDRARAQVDTRLPQLSAGRRYTARQLCGEAYWLALKPGEPTQFGEALSYLARSPTFPLVYVGKNASNHHLYMHR